MCNAGGGLAGFLADGVLWWHYFPADVRSWRSHLFTLQTAAFAYAVAPPISYPMGAFYTTCYLFKLSLSHLVADLKTLKDQVSPAPWEVLRLCKRYAKVLRAIEAFNRFWSKQLALYYLLLAFMSVAFLSLLLRNKAAPEMLVVFAIQLAIGLLGVALLAYSGDIVSRRTFEPHALLCSLATRCRHRAVRRKLVAAIEMAAANRIPAAKVITGKMSTTKVVGFYAWNVLCISDNDYVNVRITCWNRF